MTEMPAGYDAWKTDPGYGEPPEDECHHEESEIDVLTGRANCGVCGESWWPTEDEIRWRREADWAYDRHCAREDRREARRALWQSVTYPIRWPIHLVLKKIWPRRSLDVLHDDEIPF